MRVLRSRQIVSTETTPKTRQARQKNNKLTIEEPSTPAQTKEPSTLSSSPSPNPNPASISTGSRPDSVSVSTGLMRRRSLRLASKMAEEPDGVLGSRKRMSGSGENVASETVNKENEEEIDEGVLGMEVKKERDFTLFGKKFKVVENGSEDKVEVNGEGLDSPGFLDSGSLGRKNENTKGKRKLGVDINFPALEDDGGMRGVLNLRSGKKVGKRGLEGVEGLGNFGKDISEGEEKRKGKWTEYDFSSNFIDLVESDIEEELGSLDVNEVEADGAESILEREVGGGSRKGKRKMSSASEEGGSAVENLEEDPIAIENDTQKGRKRFSSKEKGKAILVEDTLVSEINGDNKVKVELGLGLESGVKISVDNVVSNTNSLADNVATDGGRARNSNTGENGSYRKRFRDIARRNASRFALFDGEEEDNDELPTEVDDEAEPDVEDWPGPFSTAMKIIKDREKRNFQVGDSLTDGKPAQLVWMPKKSQDSVRSKNRVPSLLELSLRGLADNADAIVSLDLIPDWLRHWLSQLLCDSRRVNGHFFKLLVQGSPREIRLRDCSWLTEEEFTNSLQNFDPSELMVCSLICYQCFLYLKVESCFFYSTHYLF